MISDDVSPEIERLIHVVIKSMVEKTNSNLKTLLRLGKFTWKLVSRKQVINTTIQT